MSTTKHSVYILSAQLSLLFSGAIINFGLGRFLGPSLYGQFGIVYAVATIMNLLLTPGIMQAVSKFVASKKEHAGEIAGSVLKQQVVIGFALAAAYFFASSLIAAALRDPSLTSLLQYLTPLVVIYALSAVYGGFLTGIGSFGKQATQLVIYSVSRLAATFLFAYFFSLAGAVVALPVAGLLALLYFAVASRLRFSSFPVRNVYSFAAPITIFVFITTFFLNVDLFLVKIFLQDNVMTGFYTAAGAVSRIPYTVLTALGMIMLPAVAGKLAANENTLKFLQEAFRYVLLLLLPGTAVIAATAKPLVMLLYRSEYAAAGIPLSILVVGTAALTLSYLFAVVLNAASRPLLSASVAFGMIAISVALNIVLIPMFGLVGAALATSVASLLSFAAFFAIVYFKFGMPFLWKSFAKIVLSSLLIFIIALQFDYANKFVLPAVYLFLGAVYAACLFLMKELRSGDFRRAAGLLPKRIGDVLLRFL